MKNLKNIAIAASLLVSGSVFAQTCTGGDANLGAWSSTTNPNGRLAVVDGTIEGDCALSAGADFAARHFVQDDSPSGENRYRIRMALDTNGIVMPESGTFRRLKFMNIRTPGPGQGGTAPFRQITQLKLEREGGSYRIDGFIRDCAGLPANNASKNRFDFDIPDGVNVLEMDINIATGSFRMWLNATAETDAPVVNLTVDLSQWSDGADSLRVGTLNNPTSLTEGAAILLDAVESRRQSFIGAITP